MNGSVEHLGQSHDYLRRAQNIMAWTTAIFGALLLSGLVWIANDIFHLKDQLMESDRRFDTVDAQMTALGTRIDDLNISIEQLGAEILATRGGGAAPVTGPDVSVLSTPNTPQTFQAAPNAPLETAALDAAAQPQPAPVQPAAGQPQVALTPAQAAAPVPAIAPSPPAPRDQLTPAELAAPAPVIAAVAPAAPAPAPAPAPAAAAPAAPAPAAAAPAAAPAAEATAAEAPAAQTQVAEAPAAAAPAPAPAPAAAPAAAAAPLGELSDDQLLSVNDDQIDPGDELLLLDENGNPQ